MREVEYLERQIAEAEAALRHRVRCNSVDAEVSALVARHPYATVAAAVLGGSWLVGHRGALTRRAGLALRLAKKTGTKLIWPALLRCLTTNAAAQQPTPKAPNLRPS